MDIRKEIITKYFTNINLNKEYLDLYHARSSIFKFLKKNIAMMHGKVIDVGCGIMPYKEMVEESSLIDSYLGIDFESSLASEYELGKPHLFWDGISLPLDSCTVDTAIATELLEHCPNPNEVLCEIQRVLKSGGIFIFTVPFLWNLHLVPHDEYRYTPFSLKRHLQNAGFIDIELEALGGWDASLAQMIGIWVQNRPLRFKKFYAYFAKFLIRKLLYKDQYFNKLDIFKDGVMITGICGVARKS
jgi:SAM-dependent methyltransferase